MMNEAKGNVESPYPPQQFKVVPLNEYRKKEEFEQLLNAMYYGNWKFMCVVESTEVIVFARMR